MKRRVLNVLWIRTQYRYKSMMHEAKLSKTKNHFNENKKKKIKDPDNKTERSNLGKLIMIPVPET